MSNLPDGLTTRPLVLTDSGAVYELMAAQEMADVGSVEIEEADIVGDWQRPSTDLAASSIGVFDGDRLVAYGEITGETFCDAAVHPDVRGRGIGTWVAHWLQATMRRRGGTLLGMPVPQGSLGDRLLTALGYHVRWTSWVLRLPEGRQVMERPLPEGYAVREALPDEYAAVHAVVEDAFLEWSERKRQTLEDFAAQVWLRPGFEPWHLRVVTDDRGAVVGVSNAWNADDDTYVSRLAVRTDQRNRGLAQALLVDTFAVGREHGTTRSSLSTDSRTGALGLYKRSAWRSRRSGCTGVSR